MINYFTNMGKLKALYELQRQNGAQAEQLKESLEAKLKKLSLKLERVDVQLVNQLQ